MNQKKDAVDILVPVVQRKSAVGVVALIVGLLGCALGAVALYLTIAHSPRIGYVKSDELIYGYEGMKDAQARFQKQQQVWQANIDTLRLDFQRAVNQYNNEFSKLPVPTRTQREQQLRTQEEQLMRYEQALRDKARDEDQKMTDGVLQQLNGYAKEYGEHHGFDVVFGTTQDGGILYGGVSMDITKDVLQYLNDRYRVSGKRIKPDSTASQKP